MNVQTITPQDLAKRCTQGCPIDLIDVRTPLEYREVHAASARTSRWTNWIPTPCCSAAQGAAHDPLYVICRSGSRGQQACQKFLAAGILNVVNVEGGTMAWERSGLPVHRGKRTISLQRQVQITAGSLVLIGSVLGWFAASRLHGGSGRNRAGPHFHRGDGQLHDGSGVGADAVEPRRFGKRRMR